MTTSLRRPGHFPKVIVIGLDGATWKTLSPLIQDGYLNNLKQLVSRGLVSTLKSVHPPVSSAAWVSFATGKHPAKHGVFDFLLPRGSLKKITPISSRDIRSLTFYELIARRGGKVVLINLPVSYPPRISQGENVILTSILTPGKNSVWPPSLMERIPVLKHYRVAPDPEVAASGSDEDHIEDIRKVEYTRFQCAKDLFMKVPWDLFFYLISGVDWIQHRVFDKISMGQLPKDHPALKAFQDFDSYLGWFLSNIPPDSHIFVISDHGFTTRDLTIHLNTWLWQRGWLSARPGQKSVIPFRDDEARVAARRKQVRLPQSLITLLMKHPRLHDVARSAWKVAKSLFPLRFSWQSVTPVMEETRAFMLSKTTWGIYLNSKSRFSDGILDDMETKALAHDIVTSMKSLTSPIDGRLVFDWVAESPRLCKGQGQQFVPDILFYSSHFEPDDEIAPKSSAFRLSPANSHDPEGIFVASGPWIRTKDTLDGINLVDIAPTILHLMDLPILEDSDGRVLSEIFRDSSPPWSQVVKKIPEEISRQMPQQSMLAEPQDSIIERLKGLGYIS